MLASLQKRVLSDSGAFSCLPYLPYRVAEFRVSAALCERSRHGLGVGVCRGVAMPSRDIIRKYDAGHPKVRWGVIRKYESGIVRSEDAWRRAA